MEPKKYIRCLLYNRESKLLRPYPEELLQKLTSFQIANWFYVQKKYPYRKVRKLVDGEWRDVMERVWDGRIKFLKKDDFLPTGLLLAIVPELEKAGYKLKPKANFCETVFPQNDQWRAWVAKRWPKARPYQVDCVEGMMRYSGVGGLVIQATGSGKTFVAGMLFASSKGLKMDNEPVKCLFVVNERQNLHQSQEELSRVAGEAVGMVGDYEYDIDQRITVATIQSLYRFRKREEFFDWLQHINLLVIDELHIQMAKAHFDIVERAQANAVYGLTATLRLGKKEVRLKAHSIAGPVIYKYPIQAAVEDEYLARPFVVRIPFEGVQYKSQYKDSTRRFQDEYVHCIVKPKRRNQCAEDLARMLVKDGWRTILFAHRIDHIKILAHRLRDLKLRTVYGAISSKERKKSVIDMEKGNIQLIITSQVFAQSVNIISANAGIDVSAMRGRNLVKQKVGRLARRSESKKYFLFVDLFDVNNRFEKASRERRAAYLEEGFKLYSMAHLGAFGALKKKIARELESQAHLKS